MNNSDDMRHYMVDLARDLVLYLTFLKKLSRLDKADSNQPVLEVLRQCHEDVAKSASRDNESASRDNETSHVFVQLFDAAQSCDLVSCFQAVAAQPPRLCELFTLLLSAFCPEGVLDAESGLFVPSTPDGTSTIPKLDFTPELASELKRQHPTAGVMELVRLAVQKYNCMPGFDIKAVTYSDVFFRVMGPYVAVMSRRNRFEEDRTYRLDTGNRFQYMTVVIQRHVEYCFAYECLFPSSTPKMSKYSVY